MPLIRWRNRAVTAITPHAGNRNVLIPPTKGSSTPPAVPDWTTDPPAVPDGDEGVPYSYNLANDLNTTIGVAITVTAGSLPPGLSISGTNIVGTPTTAGTSSGIQLTATNVSGADESLPFDIEITGAPVSTAARFDNPVQSGKEVLDQGTEVFSGGLTAPGVSGDIRPDGVVTLAWDGVNDFGDTGPNILLFDDSRAGTAGEVIGLTDPVVGEWSSYNHPVNRTRWTDEFARSGNLSQRTRHEPLYTGSGAGTHLSVTNLDFPETYEYFVSYCFRTPEYWPGNNEDWSGSPTTTTYTPNAFHPSSNTKMDWFFSGDKVQTPVEHDMISMSKTGNIVDPFNPNFQFGGDSGFLDIHPNAQPERYCSLELWGYAADWHDSWNGWQRWAHWVKADQTNPSVNPGEQWHQSLSPVLGQSRNSYWDGGPVFNGTTTRGMIQMQLPGWWRDADAPDPANDSHPDCRPLLDDIYLAVGPGAPARIEIGNDPVYENCTDLALATDYTWTPQGVTCTLRGGAWLSFDNLFFHAHDKNNNYVPYFGGSRAIS